MIKGVFLIPCFILLNCLSVASQATILYATQFEERIVLKDCIKQLEQEFDLEFSYPSTISQQQITPPAIQSTPNLESYLSQLFLSIGFEYQIVDNEKILLRPLAEEIQAPTNSWIWEGELIDQLNGEPILYGLIQTEDRQVFTFTDEQGRFKLPLTPHHSDTKILAHALGYTDQYFNPAHGALPTKIKLQPTELMLSEVTILETKPSTLLSGPHLEQRVDNNMAGSSIAGIYRGDLFREMQVIIPGLTAHNDANAGIQIRGGNDDETLIVLDEIPIYRADHFYGIFSSINSDYIEEYAVYKNTNPIEYGGKMSGMVDMQVGKVKEKISGKINADLLSVDANLKIPIGEKIGLSLGGRSSHSDLTKNKSANLSEEFSTTIGDNGLSRRSNISSKPNFNFWDSNAQLYYEGKQLSLEGNFYHSQDNFLNQYNTEYSFGPNANFTKAIELFEHNIDWQNIGGSFIGSYNFGDWSLQAVAYSTHYETQNFVEANLELKEMTLNRIAKFGVDAENKIQDYGEKLKVGYQFGESSINFGVEAIQHRTGLRIRSNDISALNRQIRGHELTGFASWLWTPKQWQIEVGNRVTQYRQRIKSINIPAPSYFFLPQLQFKYLAGKQGMLKGALSRKAQFVREINFQDRLGQSTQYLLLSDQELLPVGLSWNYMLGGALYFSKFTLDAEFYLKKTDGILAFSSRSIGINQNDLTPTVINDYKIFQGDGQVMGVDLALQFHHKQYSSSLAYTLSKSTNQFAEIYQNQSFASPLDSRHQLKWLHQYQWKKFDFFATYVFASGRPYSDISSLAMEALISDLNANDLIKRLPDYHRIDVGVDYTFALGKTEATIGLSCFNLSNHKNVKFQQYIYSLPNGNQTDKNEVIGAETLQLDRTFNVNFSITF